MTVRLFVLALLFALAAGAREAEPLFAEGLEAYAVEDYERAASLFEQAAQLQPSVAKYHHWFGKACGRRAERVFFTRAMGMAKKVRASFERAVELDGENVQILADLFEFYLEAPGFLGGGEDEARAIAARLAGLNPAEGHRARAVLLAKKKDYVGAEKEFRRALELEPTKVGRLLDLASFLAGRSRHAEADALFDRAAELAPNSPEYLFARGKQLALAKRNPRQARELLEQYLRTPRQPDDPPPSEVQGLLKKL